MAENKTRPLASSVDAFIDQVAEPTKRADCFAIVELMRRASKLEPVMWGSAIVGFGSHHYVYTSGREGDTMILGFSPRKQNIAIYLVGGLDPVATELSVLGKHKTGKGCLYLPALDDVDQAVLGKMFVKAFQHATTRQ